MTLTGIDMNIAPTVPQPIRTYSWAYGVLTIRSRKVKELPTTLKSLAEAGFPEPRLFVDGLGHLESFDYEAEFELPVTNHCPLVRLFGNWWLALWELYLRNPLADFFALFNDDILLYKNLRAYLEADQPGSNPLDPQRTKGYCNLFTVPASGKDLLNRNETLLGWHESNQMAQGGAGLVFHRYVLLNLFSSRTMIEKPLLTNHKAWKNVDGSVCDALNAIGYKEHIHYPSLIQLQPIESSIGNEPMPLSDCFWGENYDALKLLERE